jgi:hypothetical protein
MLQQLECDRTWDGVHFHASADPGSAAACHEHFRPASEGSEVAVGFEAAHPNGRRKPKRLVCL